MSVMSLSEVERVVVDEMIQPIFPGRRVVAAMPTVVGPANNNYRIGISGLARPFVLRIYDRDAAAAAKEQAVTHSIRDSVPVPEFLYLDASRRLISRPYAIRRWIDADTLATPLLHATDDELRQLGEAIGATLARISAHRILAATGDGAGLSVGRRAGASAPIDYIHQCLFEGPGRRRLEDATRRAIWSFVETNAGLLDGIATNDHLVHADFRKANILVARDGRTWRVMAVLDWKSCHVGTPLFDIGAILRGDPGPGPIFERGLADGFLANGGALPPGWRRAARFLDLVNLCELVDRRYASPNQVDQASRLMLSTIGRWHEV